MNWRKLGHIFAPSGEFPWMVSHAATPCAEHISGDLFRVYFTSRDAANRSHICECTLDLTSRKVVEIGSEPLVAPGELGLFDDSGATLGFVLNWQGRRLIYYVGWNLKVTVPWLNSIGLAEFDRSEGKFVKHGRVPIMDRCDEDPFSLSYPSILEEQGHLKMWYGTALKLGATQEEMRYAIKTAVSDDAIRWRRTGHIAVALEHQGEYAIARPCVLRAGSEYEMWYSYRANGTITTFRIGYATSSDGDDWTRRDDEVGIDVSESGWDSEMICYAFVFDHLGLRYMLYNGNAYGKTGFGLAVLEVKG